jgi:hemolysin activation/secretion protein
MGSLGLAAQAQTFTLSGVDFNDSVYLDDDALQGAVAPYMNTPIAFENVTAMIEDVTQLYRQQGIVTAAVVLEPQDVVDGGVLALTLVEAVLEDVSYDAETAFQQRLLGTAFNEPAGAFPDYDNLAAQIRYFQIAYGVVPSVGFEAGDQSGTTRQIVALEVPQRSDWSASLDNYGNDSEGRTRAGVNWNRNNLTGRLDNIAAGASVSAGGFSINGQYRIPVASFGGTMGFSGSYAQKDVVEGPFAAAQSGSSTVDLGVQYKQPFWVQSDRFYQFQIDVTANNAVSTIADEVLQDTTLTYMDARVTMARSYPLADLSADIGLRFGQATSTETATTDGPFQQLFANAAYNRTLSPRFSGLVSAQLQYAPDQNLPSALRISTGGLGSLVGYPEDVRTGDSGLLTSFQLTCNAPCVGGTDAPVQNALFAFADIGLIQTFRGPEVALDENETLYSAGIGGTFQYGQAVGNIKIGWPFEETIGFTDINSPRFYAGLTYNF